MRIASLVAVACVVAMAAVAPASATIIYQDTFSGTGTPTTEANGTAYTVTGTVTQSGGVATIKPSSVLFLPFKLVPTTSGVASAPGVYEYSCDFTPYGGWFGLTVNSTDTNTDNMVGAFLFSQNGKTVTAYGGIGTPYNIGSSVTDTVVRQHHLDVVFNDTVNSAWTFTFKVDGVQLGTTTTIANTGTPAVWIYGPNRVLGLAIVNNSNQDVTVDNLLFQQTPEPATMGLLAIGGIAAVIRRRRA